MIDIKTRKALYKEYSKCKWMEVNKDYEVTRADDILVNKVCIDEIGQVYLEWHKTAISEQQCNAANFAEVMTPECIQGLFTSEKKAIAAAKKWFKSKKD
jgi:hypothetical protein